MAAYENVFQNLSLIESFFMFKTLIYMQYMQYMAMSVHK